MAGGYSRRFERAGSTVIRHPYIVIGVWVAVAVVLALSFPQLERVVKSQSVDPFPRDLASIQVLDRMADSFGEQGSATMVVVAIESKSGLNDQARELYGQLADVLAADDEHVVSVQNMLVDPLSEAQAVSEDRQAWFMPVGVAGSLGSPHSQESVAAIRDTVAQTFDHTSFHAEVTGPPATLGDQVETGDRDLVIISVATILLIGLILLIIYRSFFTAMLPLVVIGLSLAVGRGILSALGELGMPVSQFTIAFMTVILLGAGTDYSVFLISRYHEQLRKGQSAHQAAVVATATIGRVILASAGTVALACAAMVFAELGVFATSGPACAVAVITGFAASVTLLPPVLVLAARRGIGLPGQDRTRRHWGRVAVLVGRRPVRMLVLTVAGLIVLSAAAFALDISYDDRKAQPEDTASNEGYRLLDRHFPEDFIISEFLVVESDVDMRTAQGLADLEQMAGRVSQLPGVSSIVGVTRPTGERLDESKLSWQNGQMADALSTQVTQGQERRSQLDELTSGADQLAAGLSQLDASVDAAAGPLAATLTRLQAAGGQLAGYEQLLADAQVAAALIDQIRAAGPQLQGVGDNVTSAIDLVAPISATLAGNPLCDSAPACDSIRTQLSSLVALRDSGFIEAVNSLDTALGQTDSASATESIAAITGAMAELRALIETSNASGTDPVVQLQQLQDGIAALAEGSTLLAQGVRALVDSNIGMLGDMGELAALLQSSATDADSDSMAGFYLPPSAFQNQDFAAMASLFLSDDGRVARFSLTTEFDPYTADAMDLTREITEVARTALPNTALEGATVSVAGFPALNADIQDLFTQDFTLIAILTVIIVGAILFVLLRAVVAPLYLLATVLLNYAAALGVGVIVFQFILGQAIFWPVPAMSFIILVAVGADYNMLLISRLREEASGNSTVGVIRTVVSTGSVITSAGLIFAASMFGLMVGSVAVLVQTGFVIGCGILLDTFVVRTLTVPAIATLVGEAGWWPAKSTRQTRQAPRRGRVAREPEMAN